MSELRFHVTLVFSTFMCVLNPRQIISFCDSILPSLSFTSKVTKITKAIILGRHEISGQTGLSGSNE